MRSWECPRCRTMRILGIESSCDETAAAVVENCEAVLSSVVASQMVTHGKYGGVVPELASREHLRAIVPVVREALERAAHQTRRSGRHRRHRRTRTGRFAAGRPHLRQIAQLCQRHSADRRQPHRRPHPRRDSGSQTRRHARGVSRARAGGERRPHPPVRSPRRLPIPSARQNPRRCRRRGFRQGRQTARLRLSRAVR